MRHLTETIRLSGKGLHSGVECVLTIEPFDTAGVILSSDGEENFLTELLTDGTHRGSDYIFPTGKRIRTCEHIFSSLGGLGIYSGIRITSEGGEMPALDGSSREISREIMMKSYDDGIELEHKAISEPVMTASEDGERFLCAYPAEEFRITCTVEYPYIGMQTYDYVMGATDYAEEIAPARTFALHSEIEELRSRGLGLGGSLKNAVIIGSEGIEADGGLHWRDEFARHKVLDIIGDMYSVGYPLKAHIIAMRPGHELNLRLSSKLKGVIIDG